MDIPLHDGKVGFYNQGNSCFVNAACQCLLRIPEVQLFLLNKYDKDITKRNSNISVIKTLAHILAEMFQTKNAAISLESLYPAIDSLASYLCDGLQHDSHELISFLLQGLEEESDSKSDAVIQTINSYAVDENVPSQTKQKWWDDYQNYHRDEITKLFYGYSVDTSSCPNCHHSIFTCSTYNTLYISLPLTHFKIHVNLVYQYMNAETGKISLSVRFIRVKVLKGVPVQYVLDYINSRLESAECCIYSIHGHYDMHSKQFSYTSLNPLTLVNSFMPTSKKQHVLLAYIIPKSQLHAHHLLVHSTILPPSETPETEMRYMILPFLICFDTFHHEEFLSRLNTILYNLLSGNFEPGTVFSIKDQLVPSFYLQNNLFFAHSEVASSFSNNFIYALKIYESSRSIFPTVINTSTMLCSWSENCVHYSLVVDWSQPSNFFTTNQARTAIKSFDLFLIPVSYCLSIGDEFTLEQGLQHEVHASNAVKQRLCDSCKTRGDCKQTIEYGAFPPVLLIQLKRFNFSQVTVAVRKDGKLKEEKRYKKQKINDRVDFPIHGLDLTRYTSSAEESIYDLCCVCNHYGTPDRGHYYSYCFDNKEKQWYEYNDESVKQIQESEVVTSHAYLLFYRKRQARIDPEVVREMAMKVPIQFTEQSSYTPSIWLNEDLNDTEENDTAPIVEAVKRIRLMPTAPSEGHFHAYNAVPQVGSTNSSEFISFIGGYKVTEKNMSKTAKMRYFRSFYSNDTQTHRGSLALAEQRSLRTGEIIKRVETRRSRRNGLCQRVKEYMCFLVTACIIFIIMAIWIISMI